MLNIVPSHAAKDSCGLYGFELLPLALHDATIKNNVMNSYVALQSTSDCDKWEATIINWFQN